MKTSAQIKKLREETRALLASIKASKNKEKNYE